ncbi:MAG: hypothetical protein FJ224_08010 [Lentisphaerae bacterium]|nr:hypothetical protein [Lentisphaerota bacterium]
MAEELQSLLDRIQRDGVDKAEAEAKSIVESARAEAVAIVKKARAEAEETSVRAANEADALRARSEASLKQAARDLLLSVQESLQAAFERVAAKSVTEAMTPDALAAVLKDAITAYFARAGGAAGIEVLVPEAQREKVAAALLDRLSQGIRGGIEIRGDDTIRTGFRIREAGGRIEHDFTGTAVTEALARLMRPRLAAIVLGSEQGEVAAPAE